MIRHRTEDHSLGVFSNNTVWRVINYSSMITITIIASMVIVDYNRERSEKMRERQSVLPGFTSVTPPVRLYR